MINKVEQYIRDNNLIKDNSTILLAVSGGPDSVAMLDIIYRLRNKFGYRLVISHFNHRIRKESGKDEEFVKGLAKKYQLEVKVGRTKKPITSEEEARKERYSFFRRVASELDINTVAIAQNKDDQAETIVHNFIRGTGLEGLSGIKLKTNRGNLKLIRPLLCLTRKDIIQYLKKYNLNFVVDKSNLGEEYTRNIIRHQVIPELKKINPNLVENLSNQANIYREITNYLEKQVICFLNANAKVSNNSVNIKQPKYLELDKAIRLHLLKMVFSHFGQSNNIGYLHLLEIDKIFLDISKEKKSKLFQGLKFVKRGGKIEVRKN